jgi:hypothetical protein
MSAIAQNLGSEKGGRGADLSPCRRYPQHIHSVPTGPILGMRECPHGLAAQPFTGAQTRRLAAYRSGGSGAPPVEMRPVDLGGAVGFLRWTMVGGRGGAGVATGATGV